MEESIRAINRIGDRLRDPALRLAALEALANYRKSFEAELSEVYSFSTSESVKIEHGAICVARFKRYATIESKLKRFPSMKLAQVQDIAGCRIIFESESSVYSLVEMSGELKGLCGEG
jgi:ppGpp synthetase/RelA/SpoT-type nucleotidyltranferase